ncbi:MAG: beta-ketoacyl-[acyl-carrier-protein] synthase family protein [Candidatus Omnitrophica bacterium]|jgi:3-oxoacyl-[acyl-carrier-protein] synthase II|nr:beta-ketoacyl-[acyl-carrier-protein] synthase family protein [Candidatus Omnitrophota bacterium]
MEKKRVVITGVGVIASNGIGKDDFWEAIFKGISGIKPISLFDASVFIAKTAGEAKDFDPAVFLGNKGLRILDRSTKLVNSAAKLALDDAKFSVDEKNTHSTGVAIGNTLGSIRSIGEFDREALTEGPQYVNPALFPNTVINSPASQISIRFAIKGFNATISTGFCASLDAMKYAVDFLKLGRAKVVLAGAVEELCEQLFLGFYKTGFLSGLKEGEFEISCPFDKRRNGAILGEGSAVFVLEDLESALSRGANIYAEISGFGSGFDSYRINKYCPTGKGLKESMRQAIQDAGITTAEIDYISAAANSTIAADKIESQAIKEVFGVDSQRARVSSIKSMTGECFSASGALQVAAAIGAINRQMIPPTINYEKKDPDCDLNYVVNRSEGVKVNNLMVNAFGPSGCNTSMVISKFGG